MSSILSQRAMLMTVSLTAWSARKIDRRITDETNAANHAAADAGRYNKMLLSKDALAKIQAIDSEIRTHYYAVTSPWLDREGTRILSSVSAATELQWFRDKRHARESAVQDFVDGYPAFVADARQRLNGMFNESDYPTKNAVASKFRFSVSIDNVPDSDDFRVELAGEQADDIRREIEARSKQAVETVVRDCYQRIADHVGRMAERLKAYKPGTEGDRAAGTFRDSLVDNVRELVALLPALNVTGDSGIAAIADRLTALCRDDAQILRDNPSVRESVASEADSILAHVSAYLA
jgi:hypothetical protein